MPNQITIQVYESFKWNRVKEINLSAEIYPNYIIQVARVATFSARKLSYVAQPSESIGNNFDITFKMKTKQDEALLMYAGHTEQVETVLGFLRSHTTNRNSSFNHLEFKNKLYRTHIWECSSISFF